MVWVAVISKSQKRDETIEAGSINRRLCSFTDIVNTYLCWPKPELLLFFLFSFFLPFPCEVAFICMFILILGYLSTGNGSVLQ